MHWDSRNRAALGADRKRYLPGLAFIGKCEVAVFDRRSAIRACNRGQRGADCIKELRNCLVKHIIDGHCGVLFQKRRFLPHKRPLTAASFVSRLSAYSVGGIGTERWGVSNSAAKEITRCPSVETGGPCRSRAVNTELGGISRVRCHLPLAKCMKLRCHTDSNPIAPTICFLGLARKSAPRANHNLTHSSLDHLRFHPQCLQECALRRPCFIAVALGVDIQRRLNA
jgi:hypothetical protein